MIPSNPKILLVRPYISRWKLYRWYRYFGSTEFSLGLLYIASYLKERGFNVLVIDGERTGSRNLITKIIEHKPDIIGITATTFSFFKGAELTQILKKMLPGVSIFMGGPHVSALPEESLQILRELDGVIVGEGEETFFEIVSGKPFNSIRGLIYRNESDEIVRNQKREVEDNLDKYTLNWDLLDGFPEKYYPAKQGRSVKSAALVVSRGCVYNCSFCASNIISGRKRRSYSPESTVRTLSELYNKYGIKEVYFHDDHFTLNKKWTERFCRLLINSGVGIKWACATRAELLDDEILILMKQSGCTQLGIGIESVSQNMLDKTGKKLSREKIFETIKLIMQNDIEIKGYFIFDIPGQELKDLWETIKFILRNPFSIIQINYFTPLPGASDYKLYPVYSKDWPRLNLRKPLGFSLRFNFVYYSIEFLLYFVTYVRTYMNNIFKNR